ncbi:ATP-dependent RecD-like DNA helicase [Cesiribacter sp. SM1]|uniref:ATP-dependent DNA helicase n=1 Tax=Cesiribacter sp. SM1 TaxID=2861196 RepID=UPI001CD1CCA7|nr:AAA family ATPase [Cesiribacter sp. SM1]
MQLAELLLHNFPFTPTAEQEALFVKLEAFLAAPAIRKQVFILKGYAGTGKTVVLQTLAKSLKKHRQSVELLAPTGRAAKVLAKSAGQEAYTVHRQLYKLVQHPFSGQIDMQLRKNYHSNTLFVVDEASMLSTESSSSEQGVLQDLIGFVFSRTGNALLLVGDPAQLPPVAEPTSVALEADVLRFAYGLEVQEHTLTEVSRQQEGSGILVNATYLRQCMEDPPKQLRIKTAGFRDIFQLPEQRLLEGLRYSFKKDGWENTLVICATNEEAVRLNQLIRQEILNFSADVVTGDLLMIARNNYQSLPKGSKINYLANGEFVEVVEVMGEEERFGFNFLKLKLRLPDEQEQPAFDSLILTETLGSTQPALPDNRSRSLFEAVSRNYRYMPRSRQVRALRKDPYLNALQVKFAYALTCHKAQGGQWNTVLLQPQFWLLEPNTADKLRWFYTAVTRASKELFIINPAL